jgi:hypothetical protein
VKPQAQKKKFRAATSFTEFKELLAPVGMPTDWLKDDFTCSPPDTTQVTLDVFRARLVSADKEDFVLQARGEVCGNMILVGTLLHPLAEADTFCSIDLAFLPGRAPYNSTITFGFENLTDPVRQVFKVNDAGMPDGRNPAQDLSYWEVQGGKLRSIFSITTSFETAGSPIFSSSSAEVTVVGSTFPRELKIDESSASCGGTVEMPSGAQVTKTGCTEASNAQRMCYQRSSDSPKESEHFEYSPCPSSRQ